MWPKSGFHRIKKTLLRACRGGSDGTGAAAAPGHRAELEGSDGRWPPGRWPLATCSPQRRGRGRHGAQDVQEVDTSRSGLRATLGEWWPQEMCPLEPQNVTILG